MHLFIEFVKNRKSLFNSQISNPNFVLGNVSADLDSVVSALVFAFFLEIENNSNFFPIINAPRAAFRQKADVTRALSDAGISLEWLIHYDDIAAAPSFARGGVYLVDHNAPDPSQASLAARVRGVIDHHVERAPPTRAMRPYVVDVAAASALTHVLRFYWGLVALTDLNAHARLLMAPLELDSALFTAKERVFDGDIWVRSVFGGEKKYFETLFALRTQSAKVGAAPFERVLRADFKAFEDANVRYGISSVFGSAAELPRNAVDALRALCAERDLSLCFVLLFDAATNSRELITFSAEKRDLPSLIDSAANASAPIAFGAAQLSRLAAPGATRKVVQPLIAAALSRRGDIKQ